MMPHKIIYKKKNTEVTDEYRGFKGDTFCLVIRLYRKRTFDEASIWTSLSKTGLWQTIRANKPLNLNPINLYVT